MASTYCSEKLQTPRILMQDNLFVSTILSKAKYKTVIEGGNREGERKR